MDSQRFNLTHGEIPQKLLLVTLPIIGSQLVFMGYNLVDMFLLGRVSSDAVAASGAAGMYMWLANGVILIGRMGAEIGVAQAKGRRDNTLAADYGRNALFISLVLGVLFGIICLVFPGPMVDFLNIREANVRADARSYLVIVGLGMPFAFVSSTIGGIFTGAGNSRSPFIINACCLVLNALLDPLFIFTFGLGIRGAAIATTISMAVSCLLFIYWLLRHRARPLRDFTVRQHPKRERLRQIFRWTIPVSLENLLFTFFSMIVTRMIASYGADALTVSRVGSQAESLCWLVCQGFAVGITAFVGQNFGAGKWTRIWEGFRLSLVVGIIWGVITTTLFLTSGRWITSLFVPDPHIADMGRDYLFILAFCEVAFCLESVAAGSFRGLGRTAPPSIASIVGNGLRIPIVYFLAKSDLGLNGIWVGISLSAGLRGLWIFVWFLMYAKTKPKHDDQISQTKEIQDRSRPPSGSWPVV